MSEHSLIQVLQPLRRRIRTIKLETDLFIYNPLEYASAPLTEYLERFGHGTKRYLFLGMNPGPFGMTQTGIPFGHVELVRDFLGIESNVATPKKEHPKRKIEGFACTRREVSGARVWGWVRDEFETPERFFSHSFIWSFCPLCFLEESGRNVTPDKLSRRDRSLLYQVCGENIVEVARTLSASTVITFGTFARDRAREYLPELPRIDLPHPSPASPIANRGWAGSVSSLLAAAGYPLRRKR